MTREVIFWRNSYYSVNIFRLQKKKTIRIIIRIRNRDSCSEHFRKLKILTLQSQYILSLLLFVIQTIIIFKRNPEKCSVNTRTKLNLHQPQPIKVKKIIL